MKRKIQGGSWQKGTLYGIRGGYARRKCYGLYWGVDALYSFGDLSGRTRTGNPLESHMYETQVEGRLGYSLSYCRAVCHPSVTAYAGYGYLHSINKFRPPSPIPCHFRNRVEYFAAGFLSCVAVGECLRVGVDGKVKWMVEGKRKIAHDPLFPDLYMQMENEVHYEVDVPIAFSTCWWGQPVEVKFTPFYRLRHYGGKENFPFDFSDTRFNLWGGRILGNICF